MTGFEPVLAVSRTLEGFDRPWWVAGGWAIDLFLGRVTREHEDVEVAILRRDQEAVRRHLAGWTFKVVEMGASRPWPEGAPLGPPVHEIHAERGPEELEILLNEADGATWRYRRDPRVSEPIERLGGRSDLNVPYLRPEIALLFKAKRPRDRDLADFEAVLPALDADARRWLRAALGIAHPDHPWALRL